MMIINNNVKLKTMKEHLIHIKDNVTKSDIQKLAKDIVQDHLDNGLDVIQTADIMSKIEALLKEIRSNKDFVDYVTEQIIRRGEKGKVSLSNGTKIECCEVATKYDYAICNDHIWNTLNEKKKEIEEKIKERETFLKAVNPNGMTILDTDTGDISEILPPIKTSTSSYKVTLSK